MLTAFVVILVVVLLIAVALYQPVWVCVVATPGSVAFEIKYLWLVIRPLDGSKEMEESEDKEQEAESKKRKFAPEKWLDLWPDMWNAAKRALKYLFSQFMIRELRASGTVGLSDPADTGMAFGIYGAVSTLIPSVIRERIEIEPDFSDKRFNVEGVFEGGIRPSSLINTGIVLLWHLPKWRMIRAIRS